MQQLRRILELNNDEAETFLSAYAHKRVEWVEQDKPAKS